MKRDGYLINYRFSEVIRQWCWIRTGEAVLSITLNIGANERCRNPFDDSLIASGSDDGKVCADTNHTCHRMLIPIF